VGVGAVINITRGEGVQWKQMYLILKVPTNASRFSKLKKTNSVTGHTGLKGCEMLRIPHCLEILLTDGGKVVSLTHRLRSTPQKHFSVSGTHFC
jgi:hypothetical protein